MKKITAVTNHPKGDLKVTFERIKEGCGDGPCPAVYVTDDGDYVIQGYNMSDCDREKMNMALNESAVFVPKDLIKDVFNI